MTADDTREALARALGAYYTDPNTVHPDMPPMHWGGAALVLDILAAARRDPVSKIAAEYDARLTAPIRDPEPVASADTVDQNDQTGHRNAALMAALADMAAAYHHERKHDGHWTRCQHPRCQNARLAGESRGPFAVRLSADDETPR